MQSIPEKADVFSTDQRFYVPVKLLFLTFLLIGSRVEALNLVATLPELASITRMIAGERHRVISLVPSKVDPHSIEVLPGMIRNLNRADFLVSNGLELELGWLPDSLLQARNPKLMQASHHLDASTAIETMGIPEGVIDRSHGDVHALGNPHYLLDPINGWKVAVAITRHLSELLPSQAVDFRASLASFEKELASRFYGETISTKYTPSKLLAVVESHQEFAFLQAAREMDNLGGWLLISSKLVGQNFVQDHEYYSYLVHRFGAEVDRSLEPKPGIRPSFGYLGKLIRQLREKPALAIIHAPVFPKRFVDFVATKAGVTSILLSHQLGALKDGENYLQWVDSNIASLLSCLPN